MRNSRSRERGLTLVELMVASVIVITAGVGVAGLAGRSMTIQRNLDRLGQVEIIRRTLRTEFDCRRSLGISPFKALPQVEACSKAGANTLYILGRDSKELFPMHISEEFYRVGDWHVRARCQGDQVRFEGRLNNADKVKSETEAGFGEWRDIFGGTSMFCREYLSPDLNRCGDPTYTFQVGWDSRGALCCRKVEEPPKEGLSRASCSPFEVLVAGGAYCAQSQDQLAPVIVNRKVIKNTLMGPAIGTTKPTNTTMAPPTIPHFLFPQADLLANIIGPWENAGVPRGGFLAKSLPGTNDITPKEGILNHWEAQCAADDFLDTQSGTPKWVTRAIAICCPRRL